MTTSQQERLLEKIIVEVRKLLQEMQKEGKDLRNLKFKKFQKTHHIQCQCEICLHAQQKNDPRSRGMLEEGFKIYVVPKK